MHSVVHPCQPVATQAFKAAAAAISDEELAARVTMAHQRSSFFYPLYVDNQADKFHVMASTPPVSMLKVDTKEEKELPRCITPAFSVGGLCVSHGFLVR